MRKKLSALFLAIMLLFGSFGLPTLSSDVAAAGNCTAYPSIGKSSTWVNGYVQWSCARSSNTTNISACLTNVTTGALVGCGSRSSVGTSGAFSIGGWGQTWTSYSLQVQVDTYYDTGGKYTRYFSAWK